MRKFKFPYLLVKHIRDSFIWPAKPYKFNFTITAGDVRKAVSFRGDRCALFHAGQRQLGAHIKLVGTRTLYETYEYSNNHVGSIIEQYTLDNHIFDKDVVLNRPWLPDWHIVRRLNYQPNKKFHQEK